MNSILSEEQQISPLSPDGTLPEDHWIIPTLPSAELAKDIRKLSEISEWRSIWTIERQWFWIVCIIAGDKALAPHIGWWNLLVYVVCVMAIASRQHCLLALMHEATHFRLSKNKSWNDFISDMFCSFPIGLSTEMYRREHYLHHQHTSTDQDPNWVGMQAHEDWHWPKDHLRALRLFAFDLCGLSAHKTLLFLFMWSPLQATVNRHLVLSRIERLRLLAFVTSWIAILTAYHLWWTALVFWFVPMVSALGALLRLRSVAEHSVMPMEHPLNTTRHVEATWLERLILAPINVNYHLAHHLYPSVPFYNLPKLHKRLMAYEFFREHAHITNSYLGIKEGVLSEVLVRQA